MAANQTRVVSTAGSHARGADERDAGVHLVRTAAEQAQHAQRIRLINRLAENLAVDGHGRVGAEHARLGAQREHGARLFDREPLDVRGRRFVGVGSFVDVRRQHLERDAGGREQFRAPR